MGARWRRLLGRVHGDRGASAIELVILAPLLLVASFTIILYAMWFDAQHAALAAAQEGDLIARQEASPNLNLPWASDAERTAMDFYQGLDTSALTSVSADDPPPSENGSTVTVTFTGTLNWFIKLHISATVSGPIECFRLEQSGGAQCG
jgi:Flp pilus assembly protein TadG